MKSLFKRLQKRKGFTLVECIVAIAVFAAFCLMVMMIVAGAQKESIMANDTEAELNGLVENVMDDDVNRSFSSSYSTKALNLNFTGDTVSGTKQFAITYDVVDGHKNFVLCTGCGYFGNNTEFMGGVSCQNFDPHTTNYKCPECEKILYGSDIELKCGDCGRTAYYTSCSNEYSSTIAWTYQPGSGSFVCNNCGSAKVSSTSIETEKFENAYVSVSGMAPNAIRYGMATPPSKASVISVTDSLGATNENAKATVQVTYSGSVTNPYESGEYSINIGNVWVPSGDKTKVTMSIPAGYYIEDLKADNSSDLAAKNVSYVQSEYGDKKNSTISWEGDSSTGVKLTFKLKSYKTGFSFDYDYQNATYTYKDDDDKDVTVTGSGLANYWFGLTNNGGSLQWPIK